MKKFISILLSIMFCFSVLTANASSVPDFMNKDYNNYTADYKLSMTINNTEEIVSFLEELQMPDEVSNFIDVKSLIDSLCQVSSVMNVQAEISDDFRRVKAAVTAQTNQNIVFNRNYDTSYRAKMGIWVDMDMDNKKLVIIYSTPLNDKYAVIDFAKDAPQEVSDMVFDAYDKMFNREFMEKNNKEIINLAVKHADITMKGNTCTVKYDNDSFVALIDDVMDYSMKLSSEIYASYGEQLEDFDIPSFKGIKLLGDKGITCTYKLSGNKIKTVSEKWDVSISLADIFAKITGAPWQYEFNGDINLTLETETDVSKIGTTKVLMPELTDENSFNISDMFGMGYDEYGYETEEWEMPKVSFYVWGDTETDTFDGERYYMPLRNCIEEAYYGAADITYENGLVTITTDCGDAQQDISVSLNVGEDSAVVNGTVYEDVGTFKIIDGSVYAGVDFYEKCLGWTLEYLQKDLLTGSLYYEFYTSDYDEEY